MATKNLARTVIEGGRHNGNKYERRKSNKEQRATERAYLSKVKLDPENFEEDFLEERQHVYKGFSDKLGPMYRWIDAQVGRPWDEVRKEIFEKFDTSTTAGRHITFDHLLRSVVETNSGWDKYGHNLWNPESSSRRSFWRRPDYFVDEGGVLCRVEQYSLKYVRLTYEETVEPAKWLAGRMIGSVDGKLHWYVPTEGVWQATWAVRKNGYYYDSSMVDQLKYQIWEYGEYQEQTWNGLWRYWMVTKRHGHNWQTVDNPFSFKLRGPLTKEETEYFDSLPERIKKDILSFTTNGR